MRTFFVTLCVALWTLFYLAPAIGSMFDLAMWMFHLDWRLMAPDRYGPAFVWTILGAWPWFIGVGILSAFE